MSRELEFEKPVLELERKIDELRRMAAGRDHLANVVSVPGAHGSAKAGAHGSAKAGTHTSAKTGAKTKKARGGRKTGVSKVQSAGTLEAQIVKLEEQARRLKRQVFENLTSWQVVQLARHPERPYTLDYARLGFTDFVELHGDRLYADDPSIVGGFAKARGQRLMLIGHQKGRTTRDNVRRNFGMPKPEGYRKALRLMRLAERFSLPIVTLIDTPGAYPGIDAEERGQAQAIAESLEGMASLRVPVVTALIGEGGSGGALAIAVANRVLMLEYSIYSVISPEGCASILFKDASHAERAADALRLTAPDLARLEIIDEVVPEPAGGAHRDLPATCKSLVKVIHRHLAELAPLSPEALVEDRYARFRKLGALRRPEGNDEQVVDRADIEGSAGPTRRTKAAPAKRPAGPKKRASKAPVRPPEKKRVSSRKPQGNQRIATSSKADKSAN
jgi:acetyl-CoA carboxylase carboxyl transferase subunit alpha